MKCKHCGMSCTRKGQDMSMQTFQNTLKYYNEYMSDGCESIMIGGGEPTLHPLFWQFIGLTLSLNEYNENTIWLATNGSQTKTALALANMAQKGVISVALSQDDFHDPIDQRVVKAFTKDSYDYICKPNVEDFREIRNVNNYIINTGRAKRLKGYDVHDDCICNHLFIKPDGTVRACGCTKSPSFGNINTKVTIPDAWDTNACYKDQPIPEDIM